MRRNKCINHKVLNEAGFSVLEAMIAIAILAAALLPLLGLQGQFVRTVESMERAEHRLVVEKNVRSYLSAVNFHEMREGKIISPSADVSWRAKPLTSSVMTRTNEGFPGRFEVQLYEIEVNISYKASGAEVITLDGLGWRPKKSIISGI